jgi:flagellar motor switch protein FliG
VVLSKLKSDHASRVLSVLPENFSMEVIMRMLRMEAVQKDILDHVERTLRSEFMTNLARTARSDSHELMADIFNNLDRTTENRFMTLLEEGNREAAERIKALMFTFDDLARVDGAGIQTLLRQVEKDSLGLALKGASEDVKELFFANMSERAGKMMKEDMEAMGAVRLKDVDEAQSGIVTIAKALSDSGEIVIAGGDDESELVY